MRSVAPGEEIVFSIDVLDDDGYRVDPDSISCYIVKFVTEILNGPDTYENGDVERLSTGYYSYPFTPSIHTVPAIYTLKTAITRDDITTYSYEYFEIIPTQREMSDLLDPPILYGVMRDTYEYNEMGNRTTDHICLIGHANGITPANPIEVTNMREIIKILGGDQDSPLIRGLLEAYNAGARDITVVAAAPMSEYIPTLSERYTGIDEWGGKNFYEKYKERLDDVYDVISGYDIYDLIVPIEAPFYNSGGVDFLTQLADCCITTFSQTANPVIGLVETRNLDDISESIEELLADERLSDDEEWMSKGKFVSIVVGEGMFYHQQMSQQYNAGLAVSAAAKLASQPYDVGLTYQPLKEVKSLAHRDFTTEEILSLSRVRLNPAARSIRGRRGKMNSVVVSTDNTMSPEGSDYWSVATIRLVCQVIKDIRILGMKRIGRLGYVDLKQEISAYLKSLEQDNRIRGFDFSMFMSREEYGKAIVEVALKPYLQIREVTFQVMVGANE